jgi:hypothetical protein
VLIVAARKYGSQVLINEVTKMEKNKPHYEKRIGNIRVAIWENITEGVAWHNVSISRRYKDNAGEWKESTTFNGLGDLAQVGSAVWLAQEWIRHRDGNNNHNEE